MIITNVKLHGITLTVHYFVTSDYRPATNEREAEGPEIQIDDIMLTHPQDSLTELFQCDGLFDSVYELVRNEVVDNAASGDRRDE